MSKILCIYPKDFSIDFLNEVYQKICALNEAVGLLGSPIDDDDYFEKLEHNIQDAQIVCFLGHGSSSTLYCSVSDPLICTENDNIELLKGKTLYLDACRSADFIKNHSFRDAIGFGFMPTSLDDVRNGNLHNLPMSNLLDEDINSFIDAKNRIWIKTIDRVGLDSVERFASKFRFYANKEIVDCLRQRKTKNFRTVADMLYYLKQDMRYFC